MPDLVDEPSSDPSFPLLNAYLEDLHAGRNPDRRALLAEHPELAQILRCLEEIDQLAPGAGPPDAAPAEAIHSDPTVAGRAAGGATPASQCAPSTREALNDFGDYQLLDEIGRGGMGVVYKARQKSLDRIVAVKMILASHLASAAEVERFQAEARAAARLTHPNIVGIHEIGERHGQHYFVMEHIEGQSLAEVTAQKQFDPERAAECVAKVARAAQHLHVQGIVHRDIKPSNILLDAAGEPHLTDFGLAKMLLGDSQMTNAGAIVGTPSFMSPEQASGQASLVGPHSDVYSLGALLYDLLTGQPPFREATPLDTLVQVLESEPRLPRQLNPRVPRDLELICMRCLEKVPEQRYESAADLADDLERFLNGESVDARAPSFWLRVRRWARREPALSSRLAVLALCVTILQVNFWITADTPEHVVPRVHFEVMLVLAAWAGASVGYQRLMARTSVAEAVRYLWAATDAILLTLILWLTATIQSPVVVVYPALIATSGLWFRQRLVWFMTAICVVAYALLMLDWALRGEHFDEPIFRHVILLVVLVGSGFVVNYQVKRIRALSRYYARRELP
jgi:serine/threonine protein kinase